MPKKLTNALTPLAVKNAKAGRHADGGGLHLLVKETGARSWVYRFMLKGKTRDIGLGAAARGGAGKVVFVVHSESPFEANGLVALGDRACLFDWLTDRC